MQRFLTNIIIKTIHKWIYLLGFIIISSNLLIARSFGQIHNERLVSSDSTQSEKVNTKSPRTAMICSLIFPGLGQLYNGKKFKALIICGVEVGLLANSIYLNQMYQKSTTEIDREFYINNRNLSTWWLIGSILFSMLDAYVDAHLSNFDESPDLSIDFNPTDRNRGIMLSLSVSFEN